MLSRSWSSNTVAQCWYMRRHVPAGRRVRGPDGAMTCTCRHCGRRIRSREKGQWDLAEGLDLDALQERSRTGHFCVVDTLDGLIVARYPIAMDADEAWIGAKLQEIAQQYGIAGSDGELQIRIVPGTRETTLRH
ncbi:hypothetical protein MTR62_13815 [Novosphingobium sp. 1949]|uniref:Uncharacterized protein n=1 Tax=Novosphingobium organovorum TaxID=2930092 RepID=A0ABT0BFF9_9SPHN|nr:hypothetical protein [Novosphingobium organovorum]MCJ2183759.1 hypothetical protein [Novosphingobium organovorum]